MEYIMMDKMAGDLRAMRSVFSGGGSSTGDPELDGIMKQYGQ